MRLVSPATRLDHRHVDVDDVAVASGPLSPGTKPWQTWWFTEVQIDLVYGRCPGGA
jgi:hypothetical protein